MLFRRLFSFVALCAGLAVAAGCSSAPKSNPYGPGSCGFILDPIGPYLSLLYPADGAQNVSTSPGTLVYDVAGTAKAPIELVAGNVDVPTQPVPLPSPLPSPDVEAPGLDEFAAAYPSLAPQTTYLVKATTYSAEDCSSTPDEQVTIGAFTTQ